LPALAQAVPTLLKVRPGLVIEKGSIRIEDLAAQGGTAPGITGKIELKDLQAKEGDKEIKFAPVLSEIDAAVEPGVGLKVRQAQVQSDFLTLQAGGTMTSLQADFQTNLDKLYNQLNQLLVLGEFKVAGNLSGNLAMKQASKERVDYQLTLAGDQIQYQASEEKVMKWEKIRSQEKGYFLLAENAVQKVALEEMNLDVDGALAVNGSGWYQLTDGSFEGQVKVPQAQLGTLSAWAGGPALSGQGGLEAQVKSKGPDDLSLVFQSRVTGLRSEQVAQEELKPIDLALDGQVAMAGKKIDGKVNVKSAAAEITSELAYAMPEKPLTLTGEDVTAMLLTGKMVELPEASARINGQVNLPALAEAVPTLLKVRPGLAIQGGSIRIQDLAVRGGRAPQVTGKIELKDLKAQEGDKVLAFEPVVADMDVTVEEKVGLKIRKTQLQSNFMTLQAAGTMTGLQAEFQSNLDKLYSQLSQLVVLGDFKAAGSLSGKLGMNKVSDEKVEYDFSLAGDQVQYQSGADQQLQVAKLRMQKKGYLVLAKNTIEKLILSKLDLDADGVLKMTGEGWYQVADKSFEGKVSIPEAQLTSLAKWGKGMGVKDLERYEGGVALEMNFQKSQPEQVVKTNGQAKVRNLRIDQKEVMESGEDITLQWTGIDCGQETVTVEKVKLASPLLSAEMGGKVTDYKKTCQLDLAGKYEGSWNRIMTLVHLLQPDLREQVVIQGTTGSDIRIQGPARVAEADPVFRGVQGTMEAGWQSAKLYGMNFAQAKLAPRLENGQVIIPETIILSEGGQVRLKGTIDLAGKEADFQLEEVTQVLDNLKLTEGLAQNGLSRINPIFANMAKTEGTVSLSMQGVNLPLSKEILKTGKGQGRLDLSNLKVEPSGILKELLTLAGVDSEGIQSAKSRGVDFVIDQGRLKYDNFVLSFGEQYEMKFYGWVGFDDTVDMVVSLPVRAALLERFGVNSASATEYAGVLEGVSLDIPLVGTRTSPKLAMNQVDMKPLIEKAMKGLMKEKGTDLLKNLLKKKEEDKKPEKSSEEKKAEEKKTEEKKTEEKKSEEKKTEEKKEVKKETKKEKAKAKAAQKKAAEEAKTEPQTDAKTESQSQPPAAEEKAPSTATEPPAAAQPPAGTEPPATTQPPAAAEPPAATTPPAATEPPAAAQPPAATEPPASTPPATTEPPAATEPPASSQPPAASEPPAVTEPPAATEPPATNEPPAAAEPPVENK